MNIILKVNGHILSACLDNNPAAFKFLELLPIELELRDYASEKLSELPRRLSITAEPEGVKPSVGDIAYYAPWNTIGIFYKDFGYASGLIKLGYIHDDVSIFKSKESLKILIEVSP